jgi:spore germination protein (amino acid permease)
LNNTINNRQMALVLLLTLTSITIITIPKIMAETAGVASWITLIIISVVFGLLTAVLAQLNRAFPGRAFYDYSRDLVGKVGCVILSVFYGHYFLVAGVFLCTGMAQMLNANFMLKTPQWAFVLVGIPVFGYAAYKGPAAVARICELYGVIFLISFMVVYANMLLQGDVDNILPLVIPSEIGRSFSAMKEAMISFLGIEVLTVMPFSKKNKRAPKIAFITLIGIGLMYIIVVECSIMMIGIHEIQYYEYSLISAFRQIELKRIEFLRRVDILYLTIGLMGIFAGISVIYTAVVEYIVWLIPRAKRVAVVIAVGVALFVFSFIGFGIRDLDDTLTKYITYVGLLTAGGIPLSLWIIAKAKKYV